MLGEESLNGRGKGHPGLMYGEQQGGERIGGKMGREEGRGRRRGGGAREGGRGMEEGDG